MMQRAAHRLRLSHAVLLLTSSWAGCLSDPSDSSQHSDAASDRAAPPNDDGAGEAGKDGPDRSDAADEGPEASPPDGAPPQLDSAVCPPAADIKLGASCQL